jgi:hypothetical protein
MKKCKWLLIVVKLELNFQCDGTFKFVPQWDKCMNVVKEYGENDTSLELVRYM